MPNRRFALFLLIANIIFFISQIPFLLNFTKVPPESIHTLAHQEFTNDYFTYIAKMTLGEHGYWRIPYDPYTSEPTQPSIFGVYYLWIGKIASLLHIWHPVMYHIARIISVEVFFIGIYLTASRIIGRYALWAGIIALTATTSPLSMFRQGVDFLQYPLGMPWWLMQDALRRLNAVAHHIFAQALLVITVYLFFKALDTQKLMYSLIAGLLILIAGIVLPPVVMPILFALPLAFLIVNIRHIKHLKLLTKKISIFLPPTLGAATAYGVIRWQSSQGFPWNIISALEISWYNTDPALNYAFLLSFGALPLIALPAILQKKTFLDEKKLIIALWAVLPFVLLPLATILSIPKPRLLGIAPFVPLAILATETIFEIFGGAKKRGIAAVAIILFFFVNLPTTGLIFQKRMEAIEYYSQGHQIMLPQKTWEGIEAVQRLIPPSSVVLTYNFMGIMLPTFVPIKTYYASYSDTINYMSKEGWVQRFYRGEMSQEEAHKFIKEGTISFVYYGPQEKIISPTPPPYSFLKKVFTNTDIIIYQVSF